LDFAVRSSPGAKLLFGGLLLATIGLKISGALGSGVAHPDDVVRAQLHDFLSHHGFVAQPTEIVNPVAVAGQSGSCQLLLINVAPQGWHRDMPGRYATATDQSFFVFRAQRYQQQPIWLTRADYYWRLPARTVGLQTPLDLVLGVVASAACDVNKLPWNELVHLSSMAR
jgi:hypothetical protein